MLLKAPQAAASLRRLDPATRLYLFGGPDESGARALRDMVVAAIGDDAERVDISAQQLRDTPSLLADEAAAISLFGGQRWVSITIASGSGDELIAPIENLLAVPVAGSPVVITVAGLTGKSRLTKVAERAGDAIVVICYPPDARDLARITADIAAAQGLTLDSHITRAIADATGGDRGLIAREVEKLALYCDAGADSPKRATMDDWRAIGADVEDAELGESINATFSGRLAQLPACLAELGNADALDISLIRAMMGRAHLLTRLRVAVDAGQSPKQVVEAQGKAIFWKEKDVIAQQLDRWTAPRLARAIVRLHQLERELKAPDAPGALLVRHTMVQFARAAAQGR